MNRIDWLLLVFNAGLFVFLVRWLYLKRADRLADVRPRCKHGVDKLRGPRCEECHKEAEIFFAEKSTLFMEVSIPREIQFARVSWDTPESDLGAPELKYKIGRWVRLRSGDLCTVAEVKYLQIFKAHQYKVYREVDLVDGWFTNDFLQDPIPRVGEWWQWTVEVTCRGLRVFSREPFKWTQDPDPGPLAVFMEAIECGELKPVNFGRGEQRL